MGSFCVFKAAEEERRRVEQEAREQEEYERLKTTFSIEGEGVGVQQLDEESEARLNREFIETIKEAKLISLERLCVKFDMKTDVSCFLLFASLYHISRYFNRNLCLGLCGKYQKSNCRGLLKWCSRRPWQISLHRTQ